MPVWYKMRHEFTHEQNIEHAVTDPEILEEGFHWW